MTAEARSRELSPKMVPIWTLENWVIFSASIPLNMQFLSNAFFYTSPKQVSPRQ
jgi:hypothetical protein